MNSVFNQLLIKMQERVKTEMPYDADTRTGISYSDQDLGQIDHYDTRPPIALPALLFDLQVPKYEQKQLKTQWAPIAIIIRLVFDPYSVSNSLAPQQTRELALAYYETENNFYLKFQDWKADGLLMLPMTRISAITEKREDKLRVRNIVFASKFEDRALELI